MYELKVDTNRDAVADIAYRFTFSPKENGMQKAAVRRVSGEQAMQALRTCFAHIQKMY